MKKLFMKLPWRIRNAFGWCLLPFIMVLFFMLNIFFLFIDFIKGIFVETYYDILPIVQELLGRQITYRH